MARYSSSSPGGLRTRLSSCADYLEAIAELRAKLLHSSPSYLISNPEELIFLVEVAKSTLQSNGISLHTFSSCPEYLSAYKAAYFGLLLQLQVHSHNARLESKDLQVRLNRLLFPLSTQLRVRTKAADQAVPCGYAKQNSCVKGAGNDLDENSPQTRLAPLPSGENAAATPFMGHATPPHVRPTGPPDLPPNVMLPPPAPIQRSTESSKSWNIPTNASSRRLSDRSNGVLHQPLKRERSSASLSRKASQDTVHFKRRLGEPASVSSAPKIPVSGLKIRGIPEGSIKDTDHLPHQNDHDEIPVDNAGSSTSSSGDDSDTDSDSSHVIVPSHSPLRRSFGIFCTGKGRGAFSGSAQGQRRRSSSRTSTGLRRQRESNEDLMDTSP